MNISRRNQDNTDDYDTPKFANSLYEGMHQHAEWQQILNLGNIDEITTGVEIEKDAVSTLSYADYYGFGASATEFGEKSMVTRAAYAQNHLKLFERIFAVAGVRVSDHEEYGSHVTYQLSGSILLPFVETRLRGNYATGYRTPSLYQLYAPTYGNADLDPEESTSYDYGVEQSLFGGRFVVDVAYFNTQYKNMIGYDSASKYINVARYLTDGIEASLKLVPVNIISIYGTYTYTRRAEDRDDNDERYNRRPKHQGSFFVNLLLMDRLNLNAGVQYVGKRRDAWYNEDILPYGATEYLTMDDYYLLSFAASYQITNNFQVFGRVENAVNEDYQEVAGYRMPGRAFYGGVKGTF